MVYAYRVALCDSVKKDLDTAKDRDNISVLKVLDSVLQSNLCLTPVFI